MRFKSIFNVCLHPGETSCPCTSIPCSNFSLHRIERISLVVGCGNFAKLRQGICINGLILALWPSSLPLPASEVMKAWELSPAGHFRGFGREMGDFQLESLPGVWFYGHTHTLLSSLAKCTRVVFRRQGEDLFLLLDLQIWVTLTFTVNVLNYYFIICILYGSSIKKSRCLTV